MSRKGDGRSIKARRVLRDSSRVEILDKPMYCGLCNQWMPAGFVVLIAHDEKDKPWIFHTSCPVEL